MTAILNSSMLNSAILDSAILNKILTQTNSIWLKLIHSDSTWWWQPSWTLPSWILPCWNWPFCTKLWLKLIQSGEIGDDSLLECFHVEFCHLGFSHFAQTLSLQLIHSDSNIIQSDLNLMMAAILNSPILNSGHLEFCLLSFSSGTHSHLPRLVPTICTNSETFNLIQSDSTWWWQPSWILPTWILPPCFLLSDSLKNTLIAQSFWFKLIQSDSNSFISHSTWWWQPSWILPSWIQTLPSWNQTPSYLLSDSLQNTLPPLLLWLKLIQSDWNWWWQPSWILPCWILPSWIQPP